MAREISLFSGYEQQENRTTNYCLLVLRMLYEENPRLLAEALATISGESVANAVGLHFRQQQRIERAVPDGLIIQKPFSVFIETKRFDWFHDSQLRGHLEALDAQGPGLKVLIALANFEAIEPERFDTIRMLCEQNYSGRVVFGSLSFEDFYAALPHDHVSRNLADLLIDFRTYLDSAGLLPRWRYLLDVVNCASSSHVVIDGHAYICPAASGAYSHSRAQYFGMYKDKRVSLVARITAVLDVDAQRKPLTAAEVRWKNSDMAHDLLVARAIQAHQRFTPDLSPARVFLLDEMAPTDFRKASKGGMLASKRYFDVEHLHAADVADLALKLNGRTWEDLREFGRD